MRHIFATEAGAIRDQVAINAIMGHADHSITAVHREHIVGDRLHTVTAHIRWWLWPPKLRRLAQVRRRSVASDLLIGSD